MINNIIKELDFPAPIIGHQLILVPYMKKYVAQYHLWMQNKELLYLTNYKTGSFV